MSLQEQCGEEHHDELDEDIVESDVELDNTDIVEPDNDPPQQVCHEGVRWMQLWRSFVFNEFFFVV